VQPELPLKENLKRRKHPKKSNQAGGKQLGKSRFADQDLKIHSQHELKYKG